MTNNNCVFTFLTMRKSMFHPISIFFPFAKKIPKPCIFLKLNAESAPRRFWLELQHCRPHAAIHANCARLFILGEFR